MPRSAPARQPAADARTRLPRCCPARRGASRARSGPPRDMRAEPWVAVPALARAGGAGGRDDRRGLRGARRSTCAAGRVAGRRDRTRPGRAPMRWCWPAAPGRRCSCAATGSSIPQLSVRATRRRDRAAARGLRRRRGRRAAGLPPARRWRLYAGAGRRFTSCSSAPTPFAPAAPSCRSCARIRFGTRLSPGGAARAIPTPGARRGAGGRRGHPVRGDAGAEPARPTAASCGKAAGRLRRAPSRSSARSGSQRGLGGDDRHHARHACRWSTTSPALPGPDARHGDERPRLRHRPRHGAGGGRPGAGQSDRATTCAASASAVHRRQPHPAWPASLTSPAAA